MTEKSRTEYSARNTTVALIARSMAILTGFFGRVVFTHTLSREYVGINGLFTDILSVLALSELGIGTAITFALYQPIADRDIEKQKSLMKLYRKFYVMVAALVLAGGLLVIPFLDILIRDQPQVDHLIIIYLMYLANAVVSYIGIYKKTLVDAHQLSYLGVVYQTTSWIIQNLLQMIVLLTTKNFLLYLSILILCTIGNNICITRKADRLFPYLRDRDAAPLPKEEKTKIYDNIKAMLMHKIGNVMVNNTDNLLLSALVGTLSVGCYSNYFLIIGSVKQVLEQIFQGITASVGNLGVKEHKERIHRIFSATFFLGQWVCGVITITMYEVLDTFVGISFGEQYVFPKAVTLILCLNFYLLGMRQPTLVFRDSMGLFRYDRYKSIAEAIINLVVSVVLGLKFGTIGVFLGTLISTVTTSLWIEPYVLYKYRLQTSSRRYFLQYGFYTAVTFLLWFLQDKICAHMVGNPWFMCIGRAVFCVVFTNAVYLLLYHRTPEFRLLFEKGMQILKQKFGKKTAVSEGISDNDKVLLETLSGSLREEEPQEKLTKSEIDWKAVTDRAEEHAVLSFLPQIMQQCHAPESLVRRATAAAQKTVGQNYRLLLADKYLTQLLEQEGIPVLILKGMATAGLYPVPELRKSGDIDLLLPDVQMTQKAIAVLERAGFVITESQHALHHVVFDSNDGFEIELHTILAEPFDNNHTNQYMEDCMKQCGETAVRREVCGVTLPMLSDAYHAFELLLHMLQHFLRSGFGLKLLCDWVVFWNRDVEEAQRTRYLQLVSDVGLKGFSDMITAACCEYLGLERDRVAWMGIETHSVELFMKEILEAEEFGKSSKDRMVALRGSSLTDYVREFHHQMHLNFPKAGKCFLLWPALWVITLERFLRNNRKLRRVSTLDVMRKAGERGRIMRELKLFSR